VIQQQLEVPSRRLVHTAAVRSERGLVDGAEQSIASICGKSRNPLGGCDIPQMQTVARYLLDRTREHQRCVLMLRELCARTSGTDGIAQRRTDCLPGGFRVR